MRKAEYKQKLEKLKEKQDYLKEKQNNFKIDDTDEQL